MRVTFLDNGLRGFGEHSFQLLRSVREALLAMGANVAIFGYRRADSAVLSALGATPHFRDCLYIGHLPAAHDLLFRAPWHAANLIRKKPVASEERTLRLANKRFAQDLESLPTSCWACTDIIVIPALTQNQILGLARFLEARRTAPQANAPKIVCQLMMPTDWTPWGAGGILAAGAYAVAFEILGSLGADVKFTAENEVMAGCYTAKFAIDVEILPVPLAASGPSPRRSGPIRLGFFGYSKAEKGFSLLPDAIKLCRERRLDVDFVVQILHGRWEAETISAERELRRIHGLRLIEGEMGEEAYRIATNDVDGNLLPYDPARFGHRGSGILTEAIAAGRPVVASAGIYASTLIENGEAAGETFAPYTAEAFADAIGRLVARFDERRQQAESQAAAFAQRHSGTAYAKRLLEL